MFKKITWHSIIIISAVGFVLLSAGFFSSLQITSGGSTATAVKATKAVSTADKAQNVPRESNSHIMIIMGDSIARGAGDEKGRGFSSYLPDKGMSVEDIGIDGLKSAGLLEQLQNENINSLLSSSNIILISIGGNDLRSLKSLNDITKESDFKALEDNYLNNLKGILNIIRKRNAGARIIFVGLYNPYINTASSYEDTKLINTWNYDTQQLVEADAGAIFIPTFDIFKFNLSKYIAADGLHPNSLGYQAISGRIAGSADIFLNRK